MRETSAVVAHDTWGWWEKEQERLHSADSCWVPGEALLSSTICSSIVAVVSHCLLWKTSAHPCEFSPDFTKPPSQKQPPRTPFRITEIIPLKTFDLFSWSDFFACLENKSSGSSLWRYILQLRLTSSILTPSVLKPWSWWRALWTPLWACLCSYRPARGSTIWRAAGALMTELLTDWRSCRPHLVW